MCRREEPEGKAEGKPGAVCLHPAASEKREGKGLGCSLKRGQVWWEHRTPAVDGDRNGRPVSSLIASSIATVIKNSCESAYVVIPTKGETAARLGSGN